MNDDHPPVLDPAQAGAFSALAGAGGGDVWDAVLEYRVRGDPHRGADDPDNDVSNYYHAFDTCAEALPFSASTEGAEGPLALVLQQECIEEPQPGEYVPRREARITEWPVEFLKPPRRTPRTIPDCLAPNAPANRLDIIRGLAKPPT